MWDTWQDPERGPLVTSTIITTPPNALVAGYHDRMPAMLLPESARRWVAAGDVDPATLAGCLAPYPAAEMEAWNVSTKVNNVKTDTAELIEPYQDPQGDLFA